VEDKQVPQDEVTAVRKEEAEKDPKIEKAEPQMSSDSPYGLVEEVMKGHGIDRGALVETGRQPHMSKLM
jgi:hypothetical protein